MTVPRDPNDGPVDRTLRPNALVWTGSRPKPSTGGVVSAVGMNEPTMPRLAVDPEGTGDGAAPGRGRPAVPESARGPQLAVTPMDAPSDPRERRGGRFKMPLG